MLILRIDDQAYTVASRKALEEGSHELQTLEDEISRLQEQSNRLSDRKQAIANFVNNHRALLAPLNRLPHDILQEVFYYCLPVAHNSIMSANQLPLLLGRVCSRWRQVLYSTPMLWTSIHIVANAPPSPVPQRSQSARLDAIEAWLSRSGVLPLSISLFHDFSSPYAPAAAESQIPPELTIVLSHAHRWRSLHFGLHNTNWLPDFISQLRPVDVPLLQNFGIKHNLPSAWAERVSTALSPDHKHSILHAPRLRSLAIPSGALTRFKPSDHWHNLTALEIIYDQAFSYDPFIRALNQCLNLETFAIAFVSSWADWDAPPHPASLSYITLRNLKLLSFDTGSGKDKYACQILDSLTAPSLLHLTYHHKSPSNRWVDVGFYAQKKLVRSLRSFFDRLGGQLEEMDLCLDCFGEPVLVELLQAAPGLKRLFLAGDIYTPPSHMNWAPYNEWDSPPPRSAHHPIDDSFLRRFVSGENADQVVDATGGIFDEDNDAHIMQRLCPNLEVVSFSEVEFSKHAIFQFLKSRSVDIQPWHKIAKLRKVSIVSYVPFEDEEKLEEDTRDEVSKIEELERESGLNVYLEYIQRGRTANFSSSTSYPRLPYTPPNYSPYDGTYSVYNMLMFDTD
ncbi:hypothetical protein NP233_g4174 [Leucocoprinus birnbaumii]|uniref:F-box domain-containing protein n=1 Tax=Leucocoprinus birnbaumii TaxID=56174 RepID=A0AAD5YVS1_9AGAR|nr:hypothetical protein NP233_g4174 [Leucocoprinus birnbaumii]